jgi:hypothetical protein
VRVKRSFVVTSILALGLALSQAQTVVEHSVTTGAGAAGAAGAKGVSRSIGKVFDSLDKTLGKVEKSDPVPPSSSVATSISSAGHEVQSGRMKIGTQRAALIEGLGQPFMKTSRVDGLHLIETYYYKGPDDVTTVTLREGKVTSISSPAGEQPVRNAAREEPASEPQQ